MGARVLTAATTGFLVLAGLAGWRWKAALFGPGTWGAGGNLVAWVLCGGLAFGWTHWVLRERHLQALAQAARHHRERLAQADLHHQQQAALIASGHDAVSADVGRALAEHAAAAGELAGATRAVLAARSPRRPAAPKAGGS